MEDRISQQEIKKIRQSITCDIENAIAADDAMDPQQAALHYWSALKKARKLSELTGDLVDRDAQAVIYASLFWICGDQMNDFSQEECADCADSIWRQLYAETGDEDYKEKRKQLLPAYACSNESSAEDDSAVKNQKEL